MRTSLLLFILCLMVSSCQKDPQSELKPRSLLKWGVALTIMTPDSISVQKSKLGRSEDITINGYNDFSNYKLQIFARTAVTIDMALVKKEQLEAAKGNPFFSKIVKEEDDGFIFEKQLDSTRVNYDFRYIRLQGDREYVFQTSLIGSFTREQVDLMYNAVKPVVRK